MNLAFPYSFDGRGRTAQTTDAAHVRDMIELFLFTNPGERVNRPEFGSGLMQLVFAPNSPELAATLQFTVQAGLQRWLGDLIEVQRLEVSSLDAQLIVDLRYALRLTGEQRTDRFVKEVAR